MQRLPSQVKKSRKLKRNRLRGSRGRETLQQKKPSILGVIQRGDEVVIRTIENVQQAIIKPTLLQHIKAGTQILTEEYKHHN